MNYSKDEIIQLNTKYGGGWIKMPQTNTKTNYVLYATGEATMSGRVYIALPNKPLTHEEKLKYNIM
jgi:hypothetical protein